MTAQDTPAGFSEWQRSVRYTYWHEPSNMILEVTELGDQFTWQIVDYMGGWPEKRDKWEVAASSDFHLDTLEEAQEAALRWFEDPDGQICRYCLSSALSLSSNQDGVMTTYHCAGCDRDDLTADDLWDEDEFIAETLPGEEE